jgi:hypothetical protein
MTWEAGVCSDRVIISERHPMLDDTSRDHFLFRHSIIVTAIITTTYRGTFDMNQQAVSCD